MSQTGEQLKRQAREVATRAYMTKGTFVTIGIGRQRCIDAAADAVIDLLADARREEIQEAASSRIAPTSDLKDTLSRHTDNKEEPK